MAEEYGFQDNFDNFNTMNSFNNEFEIKGFYVPQERGTTVGQTYSDADGSWVWDGVNWVGQNGTVDFTILDGPTITPNNSREFQMSPELMTMGVAISLADGPLPVGEIIFAGIVAYQVYLYYNDIPNVVMPPYHSPPITPNVVIPPNRADNFAQRGKNNGKTHDIEILRAKKEAGTLTKQEAQRLKRHEKNTGERPSRQSKDKKK